ncbi:hypothetical protein GQ54DRAFT_52806 [Martensiomyces pterosporus]|nr:hypothetical protein GQ54DRAFT_52806 [Martensiomyces pterosporus]
MSLCALPASPASHQGALPGCWGEVLSCKAQAPLPMWNTRWTWCSHMPAYGRRHIASGQHGDVVERPQETPPVSPVHGVLGRRLERKGSGVPLVRGRERGTEAYGRAQCISCCLCSVASVSQQLSSFFCCGSLLVFPPRPGSQRRCLWSKPFRRFIFSPR